MDFPPPVGSTASVSRPSKMDWRMGICDRRKSGYPKWCSRRRRASAIQSVTTEDGPDCREVRIQKTATRASKRESLRCEMSHETVGGDAGITGLQTYRPLVFALRPTQLRRPEPLPVSHRPGVCPT